MIVKDMIAELQKFNPELEVYYPSGIEDHAYTKVHTLKREVLEDDETEDEIVLKFSGLRDSSLDDKFKGILEWVE